MDTPNVGPDSPTVLTLLVDFAEPGLPARTQRQLGRAEILSRSFTDNEHRIRTLYDARHSYELAWAIIAIAGVAGAAAIYAVPSSQLRNSPKTLP